MDKRTATIKRQTKETDVEVTVDLDGRGKTQIKTGIGFLDHMLDHLGTHGLIDLTVRARGDLQVDAHHTAEDVAGCIGQAIAQALGDKAGICRYGFASVPMDEALADVAVDLSGRASLVYNVPFVGEKIGAFDTQLVEEFFRRMAAGGGMNVHVNVSCGANDHHIAEAVFKAFAQALRRAKSIDPDRAGEVPSTKGSL